MISLLLQATGGGLASVALKRGESVATGDNVMIAGLSFQVFTLLVFVVCGVDFALNTFRRRRELGAEVALDQDFAVRRVRRSWKFRGFLAALGVAVVCIFWCSAFRVAELSRGWDGPLMQRQDLFVGFEGVMIIIACLVLNFFHPSLCFRKTLEDEAGIEIRKSSAAPSAASAAAAAVAAAANATANANDRTTIEIGAAKSEIHVADGEDGAAVEAPHPVVS